MAARFVKRDEATKFQTSVNRNIGKKNHLSFVIVHLLIGNAKCDPDSMPNVYWAISGQ
jgi:hypothetical protein